MSETVVLPMKKVPKTTDNPENLILYAKPKAGKTTLLAALDDCLIIDLEKGTNKIDALKVQANSLAELAEVIRAVRTSEHKYKYVGIDTVTKLEEWCEADATLMYMHTPMGIKFNRIENLLKPPKDWELKPKKEWDSVLTLPMGGGYLYLRNSFKKWTSLLLTLAPHVIFICHVKDVMLEKNGKEVSVKDLDLTGKLKTITAQNADAIGYLYWDTEGEESKLMVSFSSLDGAEGGSRCAHLRNKVMPFDWSKIFVD